MFSSNSSSFEKDLTDTRIYELEEPGLGESSVEFIQSLDQFDLEQSCLLRLKSQREKIEELTKLYLENEKELAVRSQREKRLQQELSRLSELTEYKQSYIELKRDYENLFKKEQITSEQFQCLKIEFDQTICATQEEAQRLKAEIKFHKQQRLLIQSHWEAIVSDKQQQLKKQSRAAQQKQAQLVDKLNKLEEQIQNQRQTVCQKSTQLESTSFELESHLKAKQQEICNYDKLTECMRRQLSDYRAKLLSSQAEWQKERGQLIEMIDQSKIQVRLLKKDQSQKQNEMYQYKQMIKRCDHKNQALEQCVNALKQNLKKVKGSLDNSIKKLATSSQEEKAKLQMMVQELKEELERQMQEKNMLAIEIKRLRGCIDKKEQQQKQRKLLLMSEFREIDKMEKIVKKVI